MSALPGINQTTPSFQTEALSLGAGRMSVSAARQEMRAVVGQVKDQREVLDNARTKLEDVMEKVAKAQPHEMQGPLGKELASAQKQVEAERTKLDMLNQRVADLRAQAFLR